MSKFLTGKELNSCLADIIWQAKKTLLILSPYIRFDDYFRKLFDKHLNHPELRIVIVFGKNENAVQKSLSLTDVEYLQNFPNLSLIYVPNLHAKYYGNEGKGLITSLNLHDFSYDKNIEFGVLNELTFLDSITQNPDKAAWDCAFEIAESGIPLLIRRPMFQRNILSALLGKNYVKSETLLDVTKSFSIIKTSIHDHGKRIGQFPDELDFSPNKEARPEKVISVATPEKVTRTTQGSLQGYCIRTGVKIKYDPTRPFCLDAYKQWAQYENPDYPEKYCHKTGAESKKKTSFRHPILNDSYQNDHITF